MRGSRVVLGMLAVAVLAGCAGQSGDDSQAPGRSRSELQTVQARSGVVATPTAARATATVTVTATRGASATATPSPSGPLGDPSLAAVLLGRDDLDSRWAISGDETEDLGTGHCTGEDIRDRFTVEAEALVNLVATDGQWFYERIIRVSDADAPAAMQYLREALACSLVEYPNDDGTTIFWRLDDIELEPLGDESFARGLAISYENPLYNSLQGIIVVVRKGPLLIYIYHIARHLNPFETQIFARRAVEEAGGYTVGTGMRAP